MRRQEEGNVSVLGVERRRKCSNVAVVGVLAHSLGFEVAAIRGCRRILTDD